MKDEAGAPFLAIHTPIHYPLTVSVCSRALKTTTQRKLPFELAIIKDEMVGDIYRLSELLENLPVARAACGAYTQSSGWDEECLQRQI